MNELDLYAIEKEHRSPLVDDLIAEIRRLRGFLCRAHDDCKVHPALAFACSVESPPAPGDLVVWLSEVNDVWSDGAAIVDHVDDEGRVYARWRADEGPGWVDMRHVRVLRRAQASQSNSESKP